MTPGPAITPIPPEKVLRATRGVKTRPDHHFDPILIRYLTDLRRSGIVGVIIFHYGISAALVGGVWAFAMQAPTPHPEIILKLVGSYCFLIGAIAIPLVAPILLPPLDESDPGFKAIPSGSMRMFDSRFFSIIILSTAMLLPIIPLFVLTTPAMGRPSNFFDIMPFLQGLITSAWVYLLMEMTGQSNDQSSRLGRRLAVVIGFVLLHVILVGLLSQLSFATLQNMNPLKLIIDLNPFSQLFILMEGRTQNRLILNTDFQHWIDYRLYLFILTGLIFTLVLAIYRAWLRGK